MKNFALLFAATAIQGAAAHTIFTQLNGNRENTPTITVHTATDPSVFSAVSYAIRDSSYDGPIQDVTSNDIACNGGPNPTTPSSNIITVAAGSTAKLTWRHTLTSDATDVIDSSHKGPVMAYMKKVTDATTDVGYGSGWFKIAADGFDGTAWGVDRLVK